MPGFESSFSALNLLAGSCAKRKDNSIRDRNRRGSRMQAQQLMRAVCIHVHETGELARAKSVRHAAAASKTRDASPARAAQNSPGREPWEQGKTRTEPCKGGAEACTAHTGLPYRAWTIAPGLTPWAVLPGPFRADGNKSPAKRGS